MLDIPTEFALYDNYPNPFNPQTIIGYDMPQAGQVSLRVFDVLGRLVATLVNQEQVAGRHQVTFNAERFASGVYLYRIKVGGFSKVGKMILVK